MLPSILLLAAGAVGLAWTWRSRPDQRLAVAAIVAVGGLGFQVFHLVEHLVQAVVWIGSPDQPPFLTPWAIAGRDLLAVTGNTPRDVALGTELLHLVGNLIFLAGLVALAVLARRRSSRGGSSRVRGLSVALFVQLGHVVEHVILTASTALVGTAVGITTAFGALEPGQTLWTLRVLAHFALNAAATWAALIAVRSFLRPDHDVTAVPHAPTGTAVPSPVR